MLMHVDCIVLVSLYSTYYKVNVFFSQGRKERVQKHDNFWFWFYSENRRKI
jgi:hypothetical protein